MSDISKTKEAIFDTFIELISAVGYENVSMREVAHGVGIQVASIYNHFNTKNDILEFAYDYYEQRQFDNRTPIEQMKKMIETASAEEIIKLFVYTYNSEDQKKFMRMILITKIIYMRIYQDPLAKEKFMDSYRHNTDYICEIMRHGIDAGRVDPGFDIESFADLLIGAMHVVAIKAFTSDSYEFGRLEDDERILAMIARLLATALR